MTSTLSERLGHISVDGLTHTIYQHCDTQNAMYQKSKKTGPKELRSNAYRLSEFTRQLRYVLERADKYNRQRMQMGYPILSNSFVHLSQHNSSINLWRPLSVGLRYKIFIHKNARHPIIKTKKINTNCSTSDAPVSKPT